MFTILPIRTIVSIGLAEGLISSLGKIFMIVCVCVTLGGHVKSQVGRHKAVDHQENNGAVEHGRRRSSRVCQQSTRRKGIF